MLARGENALRELIRREPLLSSQQTVSHVIFADGCNNKQ
jgi:hypothetical protein